MTAMNPDTPIDLDAMEKDLSDVETALQRLDEGTYFTDEVTGAPIDPAHLAANPTARRNAPGGPAA
jgi:RNA polymerase-binding transcription factor DksA